MQETKIAVVTGGSRGIGAATVRAFAQRGYRVYFLYEKEHTAAETVARETDATAICCDVADGEAVKAAFAQIPDVDVLVCNAGICYSGLIQDMTERQWDRIFNVNVKGIFHCVNAAIPNFLRKKRGAIVNVSSMWGQKGAACEAAYSATKGAVIALTQALAEELGPSGVRANCVAPGVILTDMCATVAPEILAQMAQDTPVGRNGRAEDVAEAIVYLAEAEFVTGTVLPVNGGYVM